MSELRAGGQVGWHEGEAGSKCREAAYQCLIFYSYAYPGFARFLLRGKIIIFRQPTRTYSPQDGILSLGYIVEVGGRAFGILWWRSGRIRAQGHPQQVLDQPTILEIFNQVVYLANKLDTIRVGESVR